MTSYPFVGAKKNREPRKMACCVVQEAGEDGRILFVLQDNRFVLPYADLVEMGSPCKAIVQVLKKLGIIVTEKNLKVVRKNICVDNEAGQKFEFTALRLVLAQIPPIAEIGYALVKKEEATGLDLADEFDGLRAVLFGS